VVILHDNTMAAVVEVGSFDLSLMDPSERQAILLRLIEALKSFRFSYQILMVTRPQDVGAYLDHLQALARQHEKAGRGHYAELVELHMLHVRNIARRTNAQVRGYLLVLPFEHEVMAMLKQKVTGGRVQRVRELTIEEFEEAKRTLDERVRKVLLTLSRLGLPARRLDDQAIVKEIYHFYHPEFADEEYELDLAAFATTSLVPITEARNPTGDVEGMGE